MHPLCARTLCSVPSPTSRCAPQLSRFTRAQRLNMSTGDSSEPVTTTQVTTAPNVNLSSHQSTVLGSILDLFGGRASLAKLSLWADDAVFSDPLTIAQGRDQYSAQWYGLASGFSEINQLSHRVTDGGNPMLMDLRQCYVVKGIGKATEIQSTIAVWTDQGKITRVEDRWNGDLPDGAIKNVSLLNLLGLILWWIWSLTWETRIWRVRAFTTDCGHG